jgi:cytochrome b6-f complex iron-sulfur subunit
MVDVASDGRYDGGMGKSGVREETAEGRAEPDRRRRGILGAMFGSFLGLGLTVLGTVGGLWTVACGRFMFPNTLTEPPSRFRIGPPGLYRPDYVETRFKARYGVLVVNGEYQGKRQIYALSSICTHLGCVVIWQENEQKFRCPCHGSGFYRDGVNFEGPAPRPLERFAIRMADDGQLEVDKSKVFQEELGQWSDPACFVLS